MDQLQCFPQECQDLEKNRKEVGLKQINLYLVGLSDSIDSAIYHNSKLLSTSGYFTK